MAPVELLVEDFILSVVREVDGLSETGLSPEKAEEEDEQEFYVAFHFGSFYLEMR